MDKQNINVKAINDVYKNAHIALQSIKDILPTVIHTELKKELKSEYEGYNNFINDITAYMQNHNINPKDINIFKKASMWCAIKMKSTFNKAKNNMAEMMLKGTTMGINELTAMKNEKKNYKTEIADFIDRLLALEEEYNERLKKYL